MKIISCRQIKHLKRTFQGFYKQVLKLLSESPITCFILQKQISIYEKFYISKLLESDNVILCKLRNIFIVRSCLMPITSFIVYLESIDTFVKNSIPNILL